MTKLVAYFHIFLYMVDRTKRLTSVGLAQARPNYTQNLFAIWTPWIAFLAQLAIYNCKMKN